MANTYDMGRLNLPFVGHCTFGKYPAANDWESLAADVAVLGAPFDGGTQYRPGRVLARALSARPQPSLLSGTAALMIMRMTPPTYRSIR